MPRDRKRLGPPPAVHGLRTRRLLRQLAEQARNQALPSLEASGDEVVRAGRGMVVVLSGRYRNRPGLSRPGGMALRMSDDRLFPTLERAQIERLARHGERRRVRAGEVLFEQGARNDNFFVVLSGALEIIRPMGTGGERLITVHEAGQFSGDVDLVFGRNAIVQGRMREDGELLVLPRAKLLSVVQTDTDLSQILMRAFLLRRASLIERGAGDAVVVGSRHSPDTLRIKEFLSRNGRPYESIDVETDPGVQALLDKFGVRIDEIP